MKKGILITFEGTEGCGKSTQARKAEAYLRKKGYKTLLTREPGGTALGEEVRNILLNGVEKMHPLAELMLYQSSRVEHMRQVVIPGLESGKIVICDRFTDSTLAYQGYARGIDIGFIRKLNLIASFGITPLLTILIDSPLASSLEAARSISNELKGDRLERESLAFHGKVKNGFKKIAALEPKRIKVVKQRGKIEETFAEISLELDKITRRACAK